ncbi:MAG: hypothetical protein ACFCUR_05870 [Rhodomicrobiaceae bacterium]
MAIRRGAPAAAWVSRKSRAGKVQEYRVDRLKNPHKSQTTLVLQPSRRDRPLRLVLKTAIRHAWLAHLPDFSAPCPRLIEDRTPSRRKNARKAQGTRNAFAAEQLHDKMLFLANTGIRPDEAKHLQYRDVEVVTDEAYSATIRERTLALPQSMKFPGRFPLSHQECSRPIDLEHRCDPEDHCRCFLVR